MVLQRKYPKLCIISLYIHRRMGHEFCFLLPLFLYYPPFFKIFHINHSFFKIFIVFSSFDNISRRHTSCIIRVFCVQYKREGKQLHFHISRHIAHLGWETPLFYTFSLVYIWHCRIKLFLRHLPNCPCSNFSLYVDLFQEISPRIAKQLRF